MHYCGINLRGVEESCLTFKDNIVTSLSELSDMLDSLTFNVTLPNKKVVPLDIYLTEDECYIGFTAGYPWQQDVSLTEKDIDDALVKGLSYYCENAEDIRSHIRYISTYDCC